ncbi:MAG: hypothetical protein ABWY64_10500 [Tardiphaga sp.]
MTSINAGPNPYAQLGSAYARAAATQPSLANTLNNAETGNPPDNSAATNLTLSEAARARLASGAPKDFTTVTSEARAALDALYAAAKVKGPIDADGKTTVDLSSLDRRSLFAVATNNGGKFSPDEQKAATTELGNRFDNVLAPAAATSKLTGDFSSLYKVALDYLDGASDEEKATSTWSAQRAAVLKGVQATLQNPAVAPDIANDPVGTHLSQNAAGGSTATQNISTVARKVRATLDAQAKAAAAAGKELVFDSGRKTGQQADLASIDNRSLAAISLNQDGLFSKQESFAAKQLLDSRSRASILAALHQSQTSGDPSQLSLGILNAYSSMSSEERQAVNWTPSLRDNAVASYKSTRQILSMLRGA